MDQRHALTFLTFWVRFETAMVAQQRVQRYVVKTFSRVVVGAQVERSGAGWGGFESRTEEGVS